MVRVVARLAAVAILAGAASPALASHSHKPRIGNLPKAPTHAPRSHGHRGQSSYGGPSWDGSSYDHHKSK